MPGIGHIPVHLNPIAGGLVKLIAGVSVLPRLYPRLVQVLLDVEVLPRQAPVAHRPAAVRPR